MVGTDLPFGWNRTSRLVGIDLPFGWDRPCNYLILKGDFSPEIRKFNEVELCAVDNFVLWTRQRGATVLAAGKGWVLAMLPVLPAKRRVRAGPRGSGPGAKRRRPCPPLRAAAAGRRRDEGRPRRIDSWPPARVEQRAATEISFWFRQLYPPTTRSASRKERQTMIDRVAIARPGRRLKALREILTCPP